MAKYFKNLFGYSIAKSPLKLEIDGSTFSKFIKYLLNSCLDEFFDFGSHFFFVFVSLIAVYLIIFVLVSFNDCLILLKDSCCSLIVTWSDVVNRHNCAPSSINSSFQLLSSAFRLCNYRVASSV